jgi:hypothetical protein
MPDQDAVMTDHDSVVAGEFHKCPDALALPVKYCVSLRPPEQCSYLRVIPPAHLPARPSPNSTLRHSSHRGMTARSSAVTVQVYDCWPVASEGGAASFSLGREVGRVALSCLGNQGGEVNLLP